MGAVIDTDADSGGDSSGREIDGILDEVTDTVLDRGLDKGRGRGRERGSDRCADREPIRSLSEIEGTMLEMARNSLLPLPSSTSLRIKLFRTLL